MKPVESNQMYSSIYSNQNEKKLQALYSMHNPYGANQSKTQVMYDLDDDVDDDDTFNERNQRKE